MKTRLLFLNQCFDKTRLRNLIAWVLFTKGEKETIKIVEKLKSLGFQFATRAGISLSIDDLKIPSEKAPLVSQAKQQVALADSEYEKGNVTSIEKLQQLVDTWHRTSETLKQTVVSNFQATDKLSPVYMMAFSGARGNISQVRQLAGMRGLMADPQGQIIGFPIRSNFREGLTLTEYMISCYGARKGLVDTALRTADAGYLTRRLVDVSQHMVVKASTCATRRGIVLYDLAISGKSALSLRDRLVGRVLAQDVSNAAGRGTDREINEFTYLPNNVTKVGKRNQEISANLASQIASIQNRVSVRSPLTCSIRHGVCQLCYGWSLSEGRLVNLGEAVGIIAAQSIGEPGTQLTMRTFHTGGVFSGDVMTEIRAPYEGTAHFTNPLQGLLIRTSQGKIAFLTKSPGELVIQAKTNLVGHIGTEDNRSPNETLFALEASTVVFVRQHEKVSRTQLIAELGTEINETIEAKRTLFAHNAGQISFASLLIGTRIERNSDIVRVSRDLGFVWILSGKQPGPAVLLDFLQKGTHIVNHNTMIARVPCLVDASPRADNTIGLAKDVREFLPSILYSWLRLTNNKSRGYADSLSIGNRNNNFLYRPDNVYDKYDKDRPFTPPLREAAIFNQSALCTQPHVSYYPLGKSFRSSYNTLVWIFPAKYKTIRNGIVWFDSRYLSQKLILGELIWIEPPSVCNITKLTLDVSYKKKINPLAAQPSTYTAGTNYLASPLTSFFINKIEKEKRNRPNTCLNSPYRCHHYKRVTTSKSWIVTFEKSLSFSKEKALKLQSDHFSKAEDFYSQRNIRQFTKRQERPLHLSSREEGQLLTTGEGIPSFMKFVQTSNNKVTGTKDVAANQTSPLEANMRHWIYYPQEIQKVSTLHESINFYRNRQFDKFTFDSSLVYIRAWFSSELVYSVNNNLDFIASILVTQTLYNSARPWFLTAHSNVFTSTFQSSRQYSSIYFSFIDNKSLDGSSSKVIDAADIMKYCPKKFLLHFAWPNRDQFLFGKSHAPANSQHLAKNKDKRNSLLFLRKWMQVPQCYALHKRTVSLNRWNEALSLSEVELDSADFLGSRAQANPRIVQISTLPYPNTFFFDTQKCFHSAQSGVIKINSNTLGTCYLPENDKTERYKLLVWKNLMNCKPFLLLRSCPLQVQVVSNTKARHLLPQHPLTWHGLVDTTGQKTWHKAQKGRKTLEYGKRQKEFLHQLNLRQQLGFPLETDRIRSFFDSLKAEDSGVLTIPSNTSSSDDLSNRPVSWPYSSQAALFTVISQGSSLPLPSRTKLTKAQSNCETGFANVLMGDIKTKTGKQSRMLYTSTFRFVTKIRRTLLITDRKPKHLSLVSLFLARDFCTKVVSNNCYLIRFLGIELRSDDQALHSLTVMKRPNGGVLPKPYASLLRAPSNSFLEGRLSPAAGELVSQDSYVNKALTSLGSYSNTVLLTEGDQISMSLFEQKTKVSIGQFVTLGEEFVPHYAALASGQVVAIEQNNMTLRRTQALLFYAQGVTHVNHGQWVNKYAPILTLTYQKLVTGDIVQGIPKIEQFFEAPATREGEPLSDSLQSRLRKTYHRLKSSLPHVQAVKHSLEEIQQVLVEGILRVYLSQGVRIADKHLEIVIRQMTSKGQILDVGNTGLFQGEFVNLDRIERINLGTYGQKADYEPSVLGITQASLGAESFISAASFQETTRVLSRDTIIGKTDFLRGLKERVVLGDVIQAGTGLDDNINYGLLFG